MPSEALKSKNGTNGTPNRMDLEEGDVMRRCALTDALPFKIMHMGGWFTERGKTGKESGQYEFGEQDGAAARSLLREGYVLGVKVDPDHLADATAALCRSVEREVWAHYDQPSGMILLWAHPNPEALAEEYGNADDKESSRSFAIPIRVSIDVGNDD